jgi:ferrochelatase
LEDWNKTAKKSKITAPVKIICCYPQENGFIRALAATTRQAYEDARKFGKPRILFSAHGLPEKIIKSGDPYQKQCEMTAQALRDELNIENLDSVLCFQSRVGPMKWITPATDDEVKKAGAEKRPLVVVPVAFVSDHSETLVELDIEYRHLAQESGVPFYAVVPAVGIASDFIQGLASLIHNSLQNEKTCASATGGRLCDKGFSGCICP